MGCIRQHFRPFRETLIEIPGAGNCWECTPDEDNRNCSMYYPITMTLKKAIEENAKL